MKCRVYTMHPMKLIKRLWRDSAGFTLFEAAVSLSILSLGVVMVGQGIFGALSVKGFWEDDVVATKDLRHATSYLAGDALLAERVPTLPDGASVVCPSDGTTCISLGWSDSAGLPHNAAYSVDGDRLMRNLDGAELIIAPRVVEVTFSRTGPVVTFTMEVEAERGGTDTINLQTYLRKLS